MRRHHNVVRGKIQLDSHACVLVPRFCVYTNIVQRVCVRHVKIFLLSEFGSQFFLYIAFSCRATNNFHIAYGRGIDVAYAMHA